MFDVLARKKRWFFGVWLATTLLVTFAVRTYHAGVFPHPKSAALAQSSRDRGQWIDRQRFGMHQLILEGSAFGRGRLGGQYTKTLLERQELELSLQLAQVIPSKLAEQLWVLSGILWFKGIERYFEPWTTDEMYGVSLSAPPIFNRITDPFTRQLAYHGLHEVAQLMVDQGYDSMACSVVALKAPGHWIVGRNFDFEAGRIFDEDKILKWVFPDQGNAFVSVAWAGMVGAITGINEHGLYLSMNAAGSEDFRRIGVPSTLVLLQALQFASTAEEALQIIRDSQMFITDIFVLLDAKSNALYRIEKSPERTVVAQETASTVVTNHLVGVEWKADSVNEYRKRELTTLVREQRGKELLIGATIPPTALGALRILRDKGTNASGQTLAPGNRKAIDALIATHSVVFDTERWLLYVSQGPGVTGPFSGFDLRASFQQRFPVPLVDGLPADSAVSAQQFDAIQAARKLSQAAKNAAQQGACEQAAGFIAQAPPIASTLSVFLAARGDSDACRGDRENARSAWQKALDLEPAYAREVLELKEKLRQ